MVRWGEVFPPPYFLWGVTACSAPHPASHQVGEEGLRIQFPGLLLGGDVGQLLQAEELRDVDDVPLQQAQLPLQDVPVQVNALLGGAVAGRGMSSWEWRGVA